MIGIELLERFIKESLQFLNDEILTPRKISEELSLIKASQKDADIQSNLFSVLHMNNWYGN